MYVFEFLAGIFKKKNIGIIIYLILNILFIFNIFTMFYPDNPIIGVIMGGVVYVISLAIALSPIGEWLLRLQTGCREITRKEDNERLIPLFNEVYELVLEENPKISKNIKLYINDEIQPNAFATGRNTICLSKGLLAYSDEEIQAVLAHEFAHISNNDTDLLLVITVGNLLVIAYFCILRAIFWLIGIFFTLASKDLGLALMTLLIDTIYVGLFKLWTWIGTMLVLHTSRKNEFEADKLAYNLGYGYELAATLDKLEGYGGEKAKGLFATLNSSHPATDDRIAKLQELGIKYRRKNA